MIYRNSLGREFDFDAPGVYTHRGALHDYELEVASLNGRIGSVARKESELAIEVYLAMAPEACAHAQNELCDILAADVQACRPGRLYDGPWYVECIVKSSAKDLWWYEGGVAKASLVFYVPDPVWTREHAERYWRASSGGSGGTLDYPYDYPHEYRSSSLRKTIDNPGFAPAPVAITVYGPTDAPRIVMGGNVYEVAAPLSEGDLLIVDGLARSIVRRRANGSEENVFSSRRGVQRVGSGSYVFQPLPSGASSLSWDGSFGFDVVVYERRMERRW